MSIFVDFHILQTVPPSCVNRDDTGSPKTAVYGGTTRARVSSQAWKRAVRLMFKDLFAAEDRGVRTKHVIELVANEILIIDASEIDAAAKAQKVLETAGVKISAKKGQEAAADALFFMSPAQAKALAQLAVDGNIEKKACQAALSENPSADIALFGRMLANAPELNQDAAAQVAHAISTHTVHNEYDYFTAVDDRAPEDNAGAGHLGTVEFNSSTLYRYATVNASELQVSMGENTMDVIQKFAKAFICSMPTGKQSTFANRTFPDFVYVTVRSDQPVNLCGAFEKPVYAEDGGYVERSAERLLAYSEMVYANYAAEPDTALLLSEELPLPKLLSELEKAIQSALGGESK